MGDAVTPPGEQTAVVGWGARGFVSDVLDIVWGLSAIVLALYLALALLSAVSPGIRYTLRTNTVARLPLEVRFDPKLRQSTPLPAAGPIRLVGFDGVVLSDRPATVPECLFMAVVGVLGLALLYNLRNLVRAIELGRPFEPGNASRLRRIAGVMIAAGILADVGQFVGLERTLREVGAVARAALPGARVGYSVHVSWQWYAAAFVVFAVAHAFRMGTRLQRDHDLTV